MKIEKIQNQKDNPQIVRIRFHFDKSEITMQNTPFGIRLNLSECIPAGELGGPAFPAKVIRVVLPSFTEAERIEIAIRETNILHKGPVLVAPLQKPQPGAKSRKPNNPDGMGNVIHYKADEKEQSAMEDKIKTRSNQISSKQLLEKQFEAAEPFPLPEIQIPKSELYENAAEEPVARILKTEHVGPNSIGMLEIKPVRYTKEGDIELCTSIDMSIYCCPTDTKETPDTKALFRNSNQAVRIFDELKLKVINPAELIDWTKLLPFFYQYDYLIITDNYSWNAASINRGGFIGDQVSEFQRLVDWKKRRGLNARVITITDITSGVFGNHSSGARDLQEVIRNFLKWALDHWNISWVLLGGDVNVVPVRNAPGASEGHIGVQTANNPPGDNQSFWTGTFLKMNVVNPGTWWPGSWQNLLINATTGELIPFDSFGTATTGWYYCTDNTYTTRTVTRTQFVRVNGSAALVNATLQWLYEWNTIPTDFYYSSLVGPNYNLPGRHDWDLLDNGIYGQHTNDVDLDGVNYFPDVSVGRAPTSSAAQASTFVNKVIAYEQFRDASGSSLDVSWLHRMTLVSSNWGGRWGIWNDANFPPGDFRFNHRSGQTHTIIKLPDSNFTLDFNYHLLAVISDTDIRVMPYNDAGGRGWYYCKGPNDLSPNGITINFLFFHYFFPLPSPWVAVRGIATELTPQNFIFDRVEADGSMRDQEELRKQIVNDLPLISEYTRLYEDIVDLAPIDRAAAPVDNLTTAGLQSAINRKQHFLSLSGHGYSGGCCGYSSGVVGSSTNGLHTYIAFADSCLTNQFDAEDAVSEFSLYNSSGGAVAYIGNSRFSWIGVGDNFQRAFFHRLTTTRHLGHLNDTRVAMVNESTGFWRLYNKWVIYAQNLMGDPEMPVWSRVPLSIIVNIPAEWDIRKPLPIRTEQRVLNFKLPLTNVFIHIHQGQISHSGKTDNYGNVTLNLNGFSEGPAEITLSKIGYKPVISSINILVPSWVKGLIKFIHHQENSAISTEIGLQIGAGESSFIRVFRTTKDLPDYSIILDAATDAFVSAKEISFFVNSNREHGFIERFRFDSEG